MARKTRTPKTALVLTPEEYETLQSVFSIAHTKFIRLAQEVPVTTCQKWAEAQSETVFELYHKITSYLKEKA